MKIFRSILPFLVISALCAGGVEFFYQLALHALFQPLLVSKMTGKTGLDIGEEKNGKSHNYQVILERNLFGNRSQFDENARNLLSGLPATSLDIILLGTITGEKGDKRAIILDPESKKQEIYDVGDMVRGATIKDVVRGKVILGFRDRDEILDMTETRKYFAEMAAILQSSQEQKISPVSEKVRLQIRPIPRDTLLVPHRRKFSIQSSKM